MTQTRTKLSRAVLSFLTVFWVTSPALRAQSGAADEKETFDVFVPARGHQGGGQRRFFLSAPFGRGYLGIQLMHLTPELRIHFGVSEEAGVMVAKVEADSPAEQAGIQVGDILTEVDGNRIDSPMKLSRYIRGKEEGDSVSLALWRDGSGQAVLVTITEHERDAVWLGGPGSPVQGNVVPDGPQERLALGWDQPEDFTIALDEAMANLEEHLNSEEWQERLERIKSMDWLGVQKRMKEIETRLRALEQELKQEEAKQGQNPDE